MDATFVRIGDFEYVNLAQVVKMLVDDAEDVNIAMVTLNLTDGRTAEVHQRYVPNFVYVLEQFTARIKS